MKYIYTCTRYNLAVRFALWDWVMGSNKKFVQYNFKITPVCSELVSLIKHDVELTKKINMSNYLTSIEQELKEEWLTRTGHLIIRYEPFAKAQDAQWVFYRRIPVLICLSEVFATLSCDTLSFIIRSNINRIFFIL